MQSHQRLQNCSFVARLILLAISWANCTANTGGLDSNLASSNTALMTDYERQEVIELLENLVHAGANPLELLQDELGRVKDGQPIEREALEKILVAEGEVEHSNVHPVETEQPVATTELPETILHELPKNESTTQASIEVGGASGPEELDSTSAPLVQQRNSTSAPEERLQSPNEQLEREEKIEVDHSRNFEELRACDENKELHQASQEQLGLMDHPRESRIDSSVLNNLKPQQKEQNEQMAHSTVGSSSAMHHESSQSSSKPSDSNRDTTSWSSSKSSSSASYSSSVGPSKRPRGFRVAKHKRRPSVRIGHRIERPEAYARNRQFGDSAANQLHQLSQYHPLMSTQQYFVQPPGLNMMMAPQAAGFWSPSSMVHRHHNNHLHHRQQQQIQYQQMFSNLNAAHQPSAVYPFGYAYEPQVWAGPSRMSGRHELLKNLTKRQAKRIHNKAKAKFQRRQAEQAWLDSGAVGASYY